MAREGGMAHDLRARLAQVSFNDFPQRTCLPTGEKGTSLSSSSLSEIDKLEESFYGKKVKVHIREFAALFGGIISVLGWYFFGFNHPFAVPLSLGFGAALWVTGAVLPAVLYYPWKGWMGLGDILGKVVNPILLSIVWSLLVIPLSIALKIFKIKRIDLRYEDTKAPTYWISSKAKENPFSTLDKLY